MNMSKYSDSILNELNVSMHKLNDDTLDRAVELINASNRVFVLGLGRAGFMLRSFAMRLMHIGKEAYVVGETITPNFGAGDLLVVGSASGETNQLNNIAEKARNLGGAVLAITGAPDSALTRIAGLSILISAPSKGQGCANSIQPMASLFEQSVLLVCDSIVLALMECIQKDNNEMFSRHANLE